MIPARKVHLFVAGCPINIFLPRSRKGPSYGGFWKSDIDSNWVMCFKVENKILGYSFLQQKYNRPRPNENNTY